MTKIFIKLLYFISFSLLSVLSYADLNCANNIDAKGDKQWILSNMCHYDHVVLANIGIGKLEKPYNPMRLFNQTNAFRYQMQILDIYKSKNPSTKMQLSNISCITQNLEISKPTANNLTETRIIAFNDFDDCAYVDIGVYPKADFNLINFTQNLSKNF